MPQTHYLQTAFNAGVLDPRLAARLDIRQYYQGMSIGQNVVCLPGGGVTKRPGLAYLDTAPNLITRVTTGVTATCPNGGTTGNANDNDETTLVQTSNNIGTTNPYVVVHYDLGSAKTIKFADVAAFYLTGGNTDEFDIQYSADNVSWTSLDGLERVDTTSRTYRRLAGVSARYWRVAKTAGTDVGAVTARLGEFSLWEESATVSECIARDFSFSTEQDYLLVFSDYNVRVYQNDVRVADVRSPYPSAILSEIDMAQSADTAIITHEDYETSTLQRGTVSTVWTIAPLAFTSVPQYDYADTSSPTPTSCVQTVTFSSAADGMRYALSLDDAITEDIVYAGDSNATEQAATAENMRVALQKLYNTGSSGISVARTGANIYTVTFAGASADDYGVMAGTITAINGGSGTTIKCALTASGVSRREDIWSDTRGWPRTVTFFEGRLWFGGCKAIPQAIFASSVVDLFAFDPGEGLDSDPIFQLVNTGKLNAINAVFAGRDMQVFTTGGEFRYVDDVLTPTTSPKNQTQFGVARIRPVTIDGSTLFVQRNRKTIRDFLYDFNEDAYVSSPLTIFAPHLFTSIVEMAAYQGSGDDEGNFVYVVNGDGTLCCYTTLRAQEVAGWSQWDTDGLFKSVAVVNEDRYVIVRRSINGVSYNFVEKMSETSYLDASKSGTNSPASATVTGLSHLNGETVGARSDYLVFEDVAVSGGSATIAEQTVENYEIGLRFTTSIRTMPLNGNYGNGDFFIRRKRVVKAHIYVYQSLGVLFNNRVLPNRAYDIDDYDASPSPVTKTFLLEESTNWTEEPLYVTVSQTDPLPFTILAINIILEAA